MAHPIDTERLPTEPALHDDFTQRLQRTLPAADTRRRRRALAQYLLRLVPFLLPIVPIAALHFLSTSPDGVHLTIDALALLTFVLDVGVHVDAALLSYLGLQALPSIVGVLLLVIITAWVLTTPRERR